MKGLPTIEGRPGASLPSVDFDQLKAELEERHGKTMDEYDVISATLYPRVFDNFVEFRSKYGPVDRIDTKNFLVGPEYAEDLDVSVRNYYMLPLKSL